MLIYPPLESFFINTSKLLHGHAPPLGLLYLARVLEDEGDHVTIRDFSAKPYNEHTLATALHDIDLVGLSVLSPSVQKAAALINEIKRYDPDLPVLIGGPHCTLLPQEALHETKADICLQGDGEAAIHALKQALDPKKEFSEIPGIMYRTPNGIKQGPPPQLIRNLNTIAFPARHLVQQYVYGREYNPHYQAGDFTTMITSRGCPFSCRFCSRGSISMQQYRTRSLENILAELRDIKASGYQHVAFVDDCFPANLKQAHALFDAIIKEELQLKFSITAARVDIADQTLYKKMRQAGVTHIQFGLESGNQDVLDFYHKQITVENIRNAVVSSYEQGIFTMGSFIFSAPFETVRHFHTTLAFAKTLPLQSVSFLPLRYMVGSELWNQAVAEGHIAAHEYVVPADARRNLGLFTTEELYEHCMRATKSFYGRPKFFLDLLKISLRNDDMSFLQSFMTVVFSIGKGTFDTNSQTSRE